MKTVEKRKKIMQAMTYVNNLNWIENIPKVKGYGKKILAPEKVLLTEKGWGYNILTQWKMSFRSDSRKTRK